MDRGIEEGREGERYRGIEREREGERDRGGGEREMDRILYG